MAALCVFGNKAHIVHGAKVTIVFEAVAFIILTLVIMGSNWSDFARVTLRSSFHASTMAIMSVLGFYCLLMALGRAPHQVVTITLITSLYVVVTILLTTATLRIRPEWMAEIKPMNTIQWFGSFLAVMGVGMVCWDSKWNDRILKVFSDLIS